MNKKAYNPDKEQDTSDAAYLVKLIIVILLSAGAIGFTGLSGYKFWQKKQLVSLEENMLIFAESAQKYSNLQSEFNPKLDTSKYGIENISSIIPKGFKGEKMIHTFGGETVVGISEMNGIPSTELFITIKDIPKEKNCIEFVNLLDKTFPVIAVGKGAPEYIGVNTGMFVKSNYANRVLNQQHLAETCFTDSQQNGKVNITVWFTTKTPITSKNTQPSSIPVKK